MMEVLTFLILSGIFSIVYVLYKYMYIKRELRQLKNKR